MKVVEYPKREEWASLLERPGMDTKTLESTVTAIMKDVGERGDAALREYALKYDKAELGDLAVSEAEFAEAEAAVPKELQNAIGQAKANIEKFHALPATEPQKIETTPGVFCWRRQLPIEKVGIYVPAGSAPLFSTVLMLAIPARIAGCREIVMCSPANSDGKIDPTTLYAARLCGVTKVFKIGGAQAVAAMTFGTESVPRVYKIFGPGNQYVTEAKMQATRFGVAIDMPAGPSEVAVIADDSCVPEFVAADLLSQAEHGPDSQVVLAATSREVIENVMSEIERQVAELPRRETAETALGNSNAFLVSGIGDAVELMNEYAAEHLIIATENAEDVAEQITNAGSIFIGNYSCESAGDYASGTNHTLPTNGYARALSGVSTASFLKSVTYQQLTAEGIRNLGPAIETMAGAERLEAHKRAISVRLAALGGGDGV
ncbi:MAG: histidinol dehydrogenase [Pyrinomonadaceae bacterium]|nr:histidinol dehydrogenase [Pyrinomonadaceae bacterium]